MNQRDIDLNSNDNTLFVTGQCNNHCLMCCQPPLNSDDIDSLYEENLIRIHNAPKNLNSIGITGGEPTLLKDKLISLIKEIRTSLPETDIHLLSNGRRFVDRDYAAEIVKAGEGRIIFGIPLHSDYAKDHDIIAGAKNAYNETIIGLYNLAINGASIELRIVINAINYLRLDSIASFIQKNLPFVEWTAFMGMERVGYARNNATIWIEPKDYICNLVKAVEFLDQWNLNVDIYNIPLCLLPANYHKFACKSISDWKTSYNKLCNECSKISDCCGLFSTSNKIYEGLKPFKNEYKISIK